MSIGLFFFVFFALIAAGIIWIARSPNARPLSQEEAQFWERKRETEDDDLITNPAYDHLPGNVWHSMDD